MKPAPYLLFFLIVFFAPGIKAKTDQLSSFLPASTEISPWRIQGDSQTASGEDLYLLINGGAELYLEYGFQSALFFQMVHPEGGGVNIEIYEMEDTAAALGVFSLKKGASSLSLPLGEACALDDYYLNLLKGRYLITLTGLNQEEPTLKGLKELAAWLDGKIPVSAPLPSLYRRLTALAPKDATLSYIEGPLALTNRSAFPLFLFDSPAAGAVLQLGGNEIIVLMYENEESAAGILEELPESALKSKNVKAETESDGSMRVTITHTHSFRVERLNRYLLISDAPATDSLGKVYREILKMLHDSFMV